MINVKNLVTENVNRIWKETPNNITSKIPPLTIESIPESDIVFIGLNPSLDKVSREKLLKSGNMDLGYYNLNHDSGNNHKYFKKFHTIAEETNLRWAHFDLLYMQETKQENVKKLLKRKDGIDFIYKQLMTSKIVLNKLITENNPKIFIVNNTLSREFLGKDRPKSYTENQEHWLNYRFEWNDKIGTYTLNRKVFFFTSMLTGQRALDNGSFERLIWHIKFVEKNYINKKK